MDCLDQNNLFALVSPSTSSRQTKLLKWSEDTTLKFVQLYKEHECLWNALMPEYKDKYRRYVSSKIIADKMALPDFGPSKVPRKIKALRSTYYLEVAKIEKSKARGDAIVYEPALKWYSTMDEILRDLPHKRQNVIPTDFLMEENTMIEENQQAIPSTLNEDPLSSDNVYIKSEQFDNGNIEIYEIDHRENLIPRREALCARQWSLRDQKIRDKRDFLIRKQSLKWKRRERLEDEFIIFGKHVAAQLRKLHEEECIAAQEQIQNVISQARLRTIHRYNS